MVSRSSHKRRHEHHRSSSEDESPKEYQVEAILDKRIRGKRTQYLLKWKGYSDEDNTWEDESCLNCPDLVNNFEKNMKKSKVVENFNSNNESKLNNEKTSKRPKYTSVNMNRRNSGGSIQKENDNHRIVTRHSTRMNSSLPTSSNRRHSNRLVVQQTKTRITQMSNNQISSDDENNEVVSTVDESGKQSSPIQDTSRDESAITMNHDMNVNNNNSIEITDQSSTNEINMNESTTASLILRITPNSTSSISITRIDTDNNNTNENISLNNDSNDQDRSEIIDETDKVEKIEAVRNDKDGISFRIKFIDEPQAQWISSKIANLKYPQAVIRFWECHVEFA